MKSKPITNDHELVAAIHKLPGSINPVRDLWPGIARRIAGSMSQGSHGSNTFSWRNQALAASVVLAFAAGLMFGRQMGSGDLSPADAIAPDLAMRAMLEASEREYQAAFREFIPIGAARVMLETQAVENIEGSWSELQQAEAALMTALHDYPDNVYLNQKLRDLRAQQLGFMKQLATLDQFSRRKI